MNDTIKTILHRRSIRSYKPEPVPAAELKTIIEAGIYAPSAMNQQKWHFTVVSSRKMLDHTMDVIKQNMIASGINFLVERAKTPGFNVFHNAPTVVIITAEAGARFTEIDCGAAAENIALAADSLGVGSCLLGMPEFAFQGEAGAALKKDLGIPGNYQYIISIALGYNAGEHPQTPPKNLNVINYIND